MRTGRRALGVFGSTVLAVGLLLPLSAGAAPTAEECKCQTKTGKAQGKFAYAKAKCVVKCEKGERKGKNPGTDCDPPFAGKTLECVNKAEAKAVAVETKCKDCPECYSGGACTVDGNLRTDNTESQIDFFIPIVFCDDTPSTDDLNDNEAKCQQTMAKSGGKFAYAKAKCYAKCRASECKGKVTAGSCTPPATDPKAIACIAKAEAKCVDSINKKCGDPAECNDPGQPLTSPPSNLCALVEAAVDSNDASTYCASPNGAFLE